MEQTQNDTVSIYRKLAADDAPPYGLVKLAEGEKLFTKPTLLCCGGLMVNDNRDNTEKMANGFAKVGHALLGYEKVIGQNAPLDIVSLSYPRSETVLGQNIHDYTEKRLKGAEAPAPSFVQAFARQHLFPLIEEASGKARDLPTMKKNLRNVTVLAHSYGALFTQQLGNILVDHMKELGMNDADIHDATAQVVVVAAGPTAPLGGGKAGFTTFNVISTQDQTLRELYDMHAMVKEMIAVSPSAEARLVDDNNAPVSRSKARTHNERLRGNRDYFTKTLNIAPIALKPDTSSPELNIAPQSNEFAVTCSPPIWVNGLQKVIERPTHNNYGTVEDVRAGEGTTAFLPWDKTGHQPSSYFNYNLEKDGKLTRDGHTIRTLMSSVLTNSISNAIDNSGRAELQPLPAAAELLKLPEKTPYVMADDVNFVSGMRSRGYNDQVEEALVKPARENQR